MTRLGSKSTPATVGLLFDTQFRFSNRSVDPTFRSRAHSLKEQLSSNRETMLGRFLAFQRPLAPGDFLDYLEFSSQEDESRIWQAFQVPENDEGYTIAGRGGQNVSCNYLFDLWREGKIMNGLWDIIPPSFQDVWCLANDERTKMVQRWSEAIRKEQVGDLQETIEQINKAQRGMDSLYNEAKCTFIKSKQVIGCTTTAAAMYPWLIKAAGADVVLVEEAGEILEAHILTALSQNTSQLILIGDHKQLRPKCKKYSLTVEYGEGFDLNRSMFERLILHGCHYYTLRKQHRMVPEISSLIRSLTYPDLLDGEKTLERPVIRGVRRRVVFINHDHPEGVDPALKDKRDPNQKASKENRFEADMVLKLVKYLGQQGYKTDNMVVLTPYLGQLRLLRNMLQATTDPVLTDLDSHELIRAGISDPIASHGGKCKIRLATIDNYQGEESDIVIASLTRSNKWGDIGFMKAPERLNVLLSRARNCLIMIGNTETFVESPAGKQTWSPLFELLRKEECIRNGIAIHCEQHPGRTTLLSCPGDFDKECPDGGCASQCDAELRCGVHKCPRRCHRLTDHSNVPCQQKVPRTCDKGHNYKSACEDRGKCPDCLRAEKVARRRAERDLEMEKARLARVDEYRRELEEIQDEVDHQKRKIQQSLEDESRKKQIEKYRDELSDLKAASERSEAIKKVQKLRNASGSAQDVKTNKAAPTQWEPGSAGHQWEQMKHDELCRSREIDELMGMIGLEGVKENFLEIKASVDTSIRQGISPTKDRFGFTLLGNPGTGKTTVARLYASFLTSMGVIPGSCFKETTGSKLANGGVSGCQKLIDEVLEARGGVIFVDEAYQLSSGNSPGGKAVLDFLLAEVENLNSKVCFVLAGYTKQMETFFAHNPGFPSRFPLEMKFSDYTDKELLLILEQKIESKFQGRMKAEGGLTGLYCRIVARRVGRGRGKEGFGNARAIENMLAQISRRQSRRLTHERRDKMKPDDFLMTREDLIGPEPSSSLCKSEAWTKLQAMVGLASVKRSLESLMSSLKENYQREIEEGPLIEYNLNRVFLGSPGTGKTTIAKLYGQILVDLGLLSNGEVVVKNPSDFVGAVVGGSEERTNGILAATVGKVLVIDEAYGFYNGPQDGGISDPYRTAAVDTIVSTVHSTPGDDRCVLLLGYQDQMEVMLQNVNPGLSRRFPISSAFVFEDFCQEELGIIFDMKLRATGYRATDKAKSVALDMLERARNRPNFGNAGEVDILLNDAMNRHQGRLTDGKTKRRTTFEACDFDEDFDRLEHSETNVAQLFQDTVGCEQIVATLQGYQATVKKTAGLGLDPKEVIPFNFLFRGPPGTGKTTTARKMAKVFYDAGFLANADVLDCSASDLIGQYVGQTGPKVRQLLDKALGRVLLIDEAYRLGGGAFAQEALDEIVDAVTKEKYKQRLIIILAGYEDDINRLLNQNPGLTSRFPEVVDFAPLAPVGCIDLLVRRLGKKKLELPDDKRDAMDISCLTSPTSDFQSTMLDLFERLSKQRSWASARDVETLAKDIFKAALRAPSEGSVTKICVSQDIVLVELRRMMNERENRAKQAKAQYTNGKGGDDEMPLDQLFETPTEPAMTKSTPPAFEMAANTEGQTAKEEEDTENEWDEISSQPDSDSTTIYHDILGTRDAGVSDEVWEQLQEDARAEGQKDSEYRAKLKARADTEDADLRMKILQELIEEEKQRKKKAEIKARLEKSGRCPMGYAWIPQENGWRCAGGSHFVSTLEIS